MGADFIASILPDGLHDAEIWGVVPLSIGKEPSFLAGCDNRISTEQSYLGKGDGKLRRPFVQAAQVRCRGYSGPLQRAITDFGADTPFGRVTDKLKEHYGITLSAGAAAGITERHALSLQEEGTLPAQTSRVAPLTLITEVDGSMIPIVVTGNPDTPLADKRKLRSVQWKEARLSLVRRPDEVEPTFAVPLGDTAAAGTAMISAPSESANCFRGRPRGLA